MVEEKRPCRTTFDKTYHLDPVNEISFKIEIQMRKKVLDFTSIVGAEQESLADLIVRVGNLLGNNKHDTKNFSRVSFYSIPYWVLYNFTVYFSLFTSTLHNRYKARLVLERTATALNESI